MRVSTGVVLCALAAIAGAASCASVDGMQSVRPPLVGEQAVTPAGTAQKRMTRIVLTGSLDACKATIDDLKITGKRGKKVAWLVEDLTGGCAPKKDAPNEDWHIELEFASAWNRGKDRIVKIDRDDINDVRVHPNADVTTGGTPHEYDIYIVFPRFFSDDIRIKLIDPQLDIEM